MSDQEKKQVIETLLRALKSKPRSFSELEQQPPDMLSRRDVRIGVQALVDSGRVRLDQDMKLAVADT